ncbi:hypothetical protein BB561_003194 [Smittium simulii]|uniref:DNA polymerase alpha catalytic subunit N-terminal domain-containing protein n=1 Tax=Smittium simulii TaxID=133385 RepID=A0A2T9YMK1_9FUNG|nr:hypothetical protein BB561_003194 [Smittium simulii]
MELRQKSSSKRSEKSKDKFSALRNLRNKKLTASEYLKSTNQDSKIYDEVDEEEYQEYQRKQIELDDFVIEDDVQGYVDKGHDHEEQFQYDSDEDTPKKSNKKIKTANNDTDGKKNTKLNNYFRNIHKISSATDKMKSEKVGDTEAEKELLDSLFKDLDKGSSGNKQLDRTTEISKKSSNRVQPSLNRMRSSFNNSALKKPQMTTKSNNYSNIPNENYRDIASVTIKSEQVEEDLNNIEHLKLSSGLEDYDMFPAKNESDFLKKNEITEDKDNFDVESLMENDSDDPELVDWLSCQDYLSLNNFESQNKPSTLYQTFDADIPEIDAAELNNDSSIDLYWFDVTEKNGVLYLFGKTLNKSNGQYLSTCVIIKGIERNLFVLPRVIDGDDTKNLDKNRYSALEVHREIEKIFKENGIREFASKPVERKYAFELSDVPADTEYLKIVYGFNLPSLSSDLSGKYFERIFGTTYSPLELFLLKRKIMGPCWLRISDVKKPISRHVRVLSDEECSKNKYPSIIPLNVLSMSIKTISNSEKKTNEIAIVGLHSIQNRKF